MENELNFDRHYYLYAKHHYKTSDFITDLKIITGKRCGISPDDIGMNDVLSILLSLIYPYVMKFSEYSFKLFICDINPAKFWMWDIGKNKTSYTGEECMLALAHKCCSILALTEVVKIPFELGEADPSILPLSECVLERLEKEKA